MLQQALGETRGAAAAARRADRDDAGPDRLPARRRRSRDVDPDAADRRAAHAHARRPATTRRSRTPTKPVGPFYDARRGRGGSRSERGWDVAPDAGPRLAPRRRRARGRARCSAPSTSRTLLERRRGRDRGRRRRDPRRARRGRLDGVPGVIDKDRCSAELALAIGADLLVLLTGVPRVAVDFGTRWERELARHHGVRRDCAALAERRVPGRQHGPEDRVGGALRRGAAAGAR